MVDAKPSKEAKPKVVVNSNKQPKVEAKPVKEQPEVDAKPVKEQPKVDFRVQFTTDRKFDARDEMISWVRDVAYNLGFVAVISKSDNGGNGRKGFVTLGCQRGGQYRKYIHKEREDMTTLKCNCPFKLKSYLLSSGQWSLNVVDGEHNHEMTQQFQGHKYAERLRPEEKDLVREMTANMALPRNIMSTLKKRRQTTATTIKHIYNARHRLKQSIRGPRTEMQHLMKCLVEGKYMYSHRVLPGTETVSDIYWAHPDSVKLFNTFPTVVMLDSTYKTNKYRLPLLEFVGVTSTEKTYAIAFAYLTSEKEDNFVWALQRVRELLRCPENVKVIVTDRDQALMKAVDTVFPKSTAILCRYHILMNVKANFKTKAKLEKNVKMSEVWKNVKQAWETIVDSESEEEYHDSLRMFKESCAKFPDFVAYAEGTILGPVKEKLVSAWTDRVMHLGNTTTNRVESAHARLKKFVLNSLGDMVKNWESISTMLTLMFVELHKSFQQSIIYREERFTENALWSELQGNISRHALHFIAKEVCRVEAVGTDKSKCGCLLMSTMGLSCACSLAKIVKEGKPIRLTDIHSHWKRLKFDAADVCKDDDADLSLLPEWEVLQV